MTDTCWNKKPVIITIDLIRHLSKAAREPTWRGRRLSEHVHIPPAPVTSFKEIIHLSFFSKNTSGSKTREAEESIIIAVIFSSCWKYDVLPALAFSLVFPIVFCLSLSQLLFQAGLWNLIIPAWMREGVNGTKASEICQWFHHMFDSWLW